MKLRYSEQGTMNVLLVPVITLALLFIAAGSFAAWAFSSRQDYKNNSDAKSAAAVAVNKSAVQAEDAKQFAEAAKNPLKPYVGPEAYGSVKVLYPKTWSAYVDTTDSSTPVKAYL
jgi:flagellar basal body-associated protein FliL